MEKKRFWHICHSTAPLLSQTVKFVLRPAVFPPEKDTAALCLSTAVITNNVDMRSDYDLQDILVVFCFHIWLHMHVNVGFKILCCTEKTCL